ncbi:MAG TPA: retron system putative HNH endonuclease [Candidatus Kapabacteria bacterium]|nr:retron system putative HNH endonuclease [Candidatus Kapabacteria bacterium]
MRRVEKDFQKPPVELKACVQKYKMIFLAENKDEALKSNYYQNARKALEELYHGKCAYCEISNKTGSYMRIDHYRPKSLYPWLAVEWSNLVYSCEICNTKKGNQFPLPEGISRVIKGEPGSAESLANSRVLLDENPLLLHPELNDPRQHLEFQIDGIIKGKNGSKIGETTIKVCDLNRIDLRIARKTQIDRILSRINEITEFIAVLIMKSPEVYYRDEIFWLSFYSKTFHALRKLQEPKDQNAFTLLGFYMYEEFPYFIIGRLPENDMRLIVRKAFMLFKEGKLEVNTL